MAINTTTLQKYRKMLKFLGLVLITYFVLMPIGAKAQFFEGAITYEVRYQSRIPGMSDQVLTKMMGTVQTFHIKGNRYLTLMNGEMMVMQLYEPKENKLYFQTTESDTLLWMDGAKNGSPILKTERDKKGATILGYDCEKIIFSTKTGKETYWFTPALKADAAGMSRHAYNNLSAFLKASGALPLKMIVEQTDLVLTMEAKAVQLQKLEDIFFALPPKMVAIPAPF